MRLSKEFKTLNSNFFIFFLSFQQASWKLKLNIIYLKGYIIETGI